MRLTSYTQSTPFRLALALTAVFCFTVVIAGTFIYFEIDENLDDRISQAAEMTAAGFADRYSSVDASDLAAAVEARTSVADGDDVMLWLGTHSGDKVAGTSLTAPLDLEPGDVFGNVLQPGLDDEFRIAIRDIGELRLIAAVSYEDADEIRSEALVTFQWALVFIVLISTTAAVMLAQRGQKRIDEIGKTLRAVSLGIMTARVPVTSANDDLGRVSLKINDALARLQTTVDGIRHVSMSIAHDLRTPINRLGILLEQMPRRDERGFEEKRDEAQNEIVAISQTFDSLLQIAKVESGVANRNFQVVNLLNLAAALVETYEAVAEAAGQSLQFESGARESIEVNGDQVLLFQLFSNLVENIVRHCPPGTSIRMRVGVKKNNPWMSIEDDGPGIPAAERENVVQAFYRLDRSRHTPGSGLGMALVKSICDLHGGILILEGNEPGLVVRVEFNGSG